MDPMSQAIDEAVPGSKQEDHNGVHFFYSYVMKMDELGNNIPGTGSWKPCVLIMSAHHKNQEVRRPATSVDQTKYATKWFQFMANKPNELVAKQKYLEEQMASLRKLIGGDVVTPTVKRRGRPPKQAAAGVPH